MGDWTTNTIMVWRGLGPDGLPKNYKVSDHSRQPISVPFERHGSDKRTADGTLRRFIIRSTRNWGMSWDSLPSIAGPNGYVKPVDGGMSGRDLEEFYYNNQGAFRMVLRNGSAMGKTIPPVAVNGPGRYEDDDFLGVDVMITDFSYEVVKRGVVDLWQVSLTLDEV